MQPDFIPKLSVVLDGYLSQAEFRDLATVYSVPLDCASASHFNWLAAAKEITECLPQGNTRSLLDAVLELVEDRNDDGVFNTRYETQVYHQRMTVKIRTVRECLKSGASRNEIALPAGRVFSAPSMLRELLGEATRPILVVDPYVGRRTLDTLRSTSTPIRLLTAANARAIEAGFSAACILFRNEGFDIEVRRANHLHDRHLAFNGRCWLVGGSLKDAGEAMFNATEIMDTRDAAVRLLEERWAQATPYDPRDDVQ